ncbi:MAG: hypothetical protein II689_01615, partial [Firmicutes bacterium]|nr:hypothetical protein [Bacillota bacterium]
MAVKAGHGAKPIAAAALLLSVFLAFYRPAFAQGAEPGEVRITSVRLAYTLDLWHYSGNYWSVGNAGSVQIRVSDAVMDAYGGVAAYLNATTDRASFSVDVPQDIKDFIAGGGSVRASVEGIYGSDLNMLFDMSSLVVSENSEDRYTFSVDAIFATVRGQDFSDFVSNLQKSIPLIDLDYGSNIYAIYGNGLKGTQASGIFDDDAPHVPCSPYLHPSDIADTSGALKSGNEVMIGSHVRASDGYSVGSGTFAGAGACGLSFRYYLDLVFYGTPADSGEEPDEPGQAQPPEPEPEPEPEIILEPELALPAETYVGHTVTARDSSTYVVDGERISAAQAYRNSLATNSFSVSPSGSHSFTPASTATMREIVFSEPGTYAVRLDINAGQK